MMKILVFLFTSIKKRKYFDFKYDKIRKLLNRWEFRSFVWILWGLFIKSIYYIYVFMYFLIKDSKVQRILSQFMVHWHRGSSHLLKKNQLFVCSQLKINFQVHYDMTRCPMGVPLYYLTITENGRCPNLSHSNEWHALDEDCTDVMY